MMIMPVILFLSLVLTLFVWGYIFGQQNKNPVNRAILLATGWSLIWILLDLLMVLNSFPGNESLVFRIMRPFSIMIGFLGLNFVYHLIDRPIDLPYKTALLCSVVAAVIELGLEHELIFMEGQFAYPLSQTQKLDAYLALVPVCTVIYGLVLNGRAVGRTVNRQLRSSLLMVFVGLVCTVFVAAFVMVGLPTLWQIEYLSPLGSASVGFFCYFVYRAVTRNKFLIVTVEQVAEELFQEARDGIVFLDLTGRVSRMNHAAQQIFDLDEEEPQAAHLTELLPAYKLNEPSQKQDVVVLVDKLKRYLEVSHAPVKSGDRQIGSVVILHDMTEKKRVEKTLLEAQEQLKNEILTKESELEKARKIEAIGTLAGGIAHDFNNLLGAVIGFAEVAQEDLPSDNPVRNDLREVQIAGERAKNIVKQILVFSRRSKTKMEHLDIAQVVQDALALVEVSLPPTVQLVREIDIDDVEIEGDTVSLQQVIVNLCTNSYQAMSGIGGEIKVSLALVNLSEQFTEEHPLLVPGLHVQLRVADTGSGMDRETLEQIFEPLFTSGRGEEASGLGLSTVLDIVQIHDGAITVESELGLGTAATIHLPLMQRTSYSDSSLSYKAGLGMRILFVDDEVKVTRRVERLLKSLGYRIVASTSGPKAVELFKKSPEGFDLLIADQTMPHMTGTQLTEEIFEIRPNLPVILVTAFQDSLLPAHATDIGIKMIIHKPITKEKIERAIAEVMQLSADAQALTNMDVMPLSDESEEVIS